MESLVITILAVFCFVFFVSCIVLIYLLFTSEKKRSNFEEKTFEKISSFQEDIINKYENFTEEQRLKDTKIAMENQTLLSTVKEYNRFFSIMAETLKEDSYFLRGELARRINSVSDTIPELRDFNKGLQTLELHIDAIFKTMKEMKVIEGDEEDSPRG